MWYCCTNLSHRSTHLNVYTTTKIPAHSSKTAFTHDSGSSSACWALLCWNWSDKLLLLTGQQVSLAREQSAPPPLTVCTVLLPSCGHRDRGGSAARCCCCGGGGGTHSTCVTSQTAAYLLLASDGGEHTHYMHASLSLTLFDTLL